MNARLLPLLLLPLLALCSCGSFERQWKKSLADYEAGMTKAPEGPWAGTWTTTTNGHTGDLRAIVTESKKSPGELQFHYHATWGKMFQGAFKADFPATTAGGTTKIDGEQSLGLFGTFGHRGTITRDRFNATYSSKKGDLGVFEMKRPR